jgi:hypothetical protein
MKLPRWRLGPTRITKAAAAIAATTARPSTVWAMLRASMATIQQAMIAGTSTSTARHST